MKFKKVKKLASAITLCLMAITLSGCQDATEIALESPLTMKEALDYYNKEFSEAEFSKGIYTVTDSGLQYTEVEDEIKNAVIVARKHVESTLTGSYNPDSRLSVENFEFLKNFLDDKSLFEKTGDKVLKVSNYYINDVSYIASNSPGGTPKETAFYLGINGAVNNSGVVDTNFMSNLHAKVLAATKVSPAGFEISVANQATVEIMENTTDNQETNEADNNTKGNNKQTEKNNDTTTSNVNEQNKENNQNNQENVSDLGDKNKGEQEKTEGKQEEAEQEVPEKPAVNPDKQEEEDKESVEIIAGDYGLIGRTPRYNTLTYNRVGGSLAELAIMPDLNAVYNIALPRLGGYGIHDGGNAGMKLFGYDRSSDKGEIVLRYVFRKKVNDPSKLEVVTVFPISMKMSSELKDNNPIISDLINVKIKECLERFNRSICNNDLSGLMCGDNIRDIGIGLKEAHHNKYARYMSHSIEIDKVIDKKGNYYLAKITRCTQEQPKGSSYIASYVDTGYVVMQHIGGKMTINDIMYTTRKMVNDPDIRNDIEERIELVGSDLTREVSKKHKDEINKALYNLYKQSNDRSNKGMQECFNNNEQEVPNIKMEYMKMRLQLMLTKYGADRKSEYSGKVTKWLGEAGSRVELIAEEKIVYSGMKNAVAMETYYLLSNTSGKWVIDEVKYLKTEFIEVKK
jgi:hypothetical protein